MHTFTIQIRDCATPAIDVRMSLNDLKRLPEQQRVEPLQRLLLDLVAQLRRSEIGVWEIAGALLGASVQDFVEDLGKMNEQQGAQALINYFKAVALATGNTQDF